MAQRLDHTKRMKRAGEQRESEGRAHGQTGREGGARIARFALGLAVTFAVGGESGGTELGRVASGWHKWQGGGGGKTLICGLVSFCSGSGFDAAPQPMRAACAVFRPAQQERRNLGAQCACGTSPGLAGRAALEAARPCTSAAC